MGFRRTLCGLNNIQSSSSEVLTVRGPVGGRNSRRIRRPLRQHMTTLSAPINSNETRSLLVGAEDTAMRTPSKSTAASSTSLEIHSRSTSEQYVPAADPTKIFNRFRKIHGVSPGLSLSVLHSYWNGYNQQFIQPTNSEGKLSSSLLNSSGSADEDGAHQSIPWGCFKSVLDTFSPSAPIESSSHHHAHEDAWGGGSSKGRSNNSMQKRGTLDTAHVWSERGLVATQWLANPEISNRSVAVSSSSSPTTSNGDMGASSAHVHSVLSLQEALEIALNYGSADHHVVRLLVLILHETVSEDVFNATLIDITRAIKAPMRAGLLLQTLTVSGRSRDMFPKVSITAIRTCVERLQQFVDGTVVGIGKTATPELVAQRLVQRAPGADYRSMELPPGLIASIIEWIVLRTPTAPPQEAEAVLVETLMLGTHLSHTSLVDAHRLLSSTPRLLADRSVCVVFMFLVGQAYKRTAGFTTTGPTGTLHVISLAIAHTALAPSSSGKNPSKEVISLVVTAMCALQSYDALLELRVTYDCMRAHPLPEIAIALCSDHRSVEVSHVTQSLEVLKHICASRKEWVGTIPPAITNALQRVAFCIGASGEPQQIAQFVSVLFKFHSPTLWLNVYLDHTTSGIIERIKIQNQQPTVEASEFVKVISALVHAVAQQRSMDTNADTTMQLIEEMTKSPQAVQLITVAVRGFGRLFDSYPRTTEVIESNSERLTAVPREQRITRKLRTYQKTVRLTMLTGSYMQHNTLCYLRDNHMIKTAEHLAFIWKLDITQLLESMRSVAPGDQLWECRSCHRFNNAKFMYCSCNALRFSSVSCPGCGLVQDERNGACVACDASFKAILTSPQGSEIAKASIVPREMWVCKSCNSSNPSFQSTFCLRCKTATGPCAQHVQKKPAKTPPSTKASSSCKKCKSPSALGFDLYPVCTDCGSPSEAFVDGAASKGAKVWKCDHCGLWSPTNITRCPHCPQVELRGVSPVRDMKPVMCTMCNTINENCLQSECDKCGGSLDSSKPVVVDVCTQCFTANPPGTQKCQTCDSNLNADESSKVAVPSCFRQCDSCHKSVSPLNITIICEHCDAYVPYNKTVEATHLVASCDTLLTRMENAAPASLLPLIEGFWRTLSGFSTPQGIEVAKPLLNDVIAFALSIFKKNTLIGSRGIALTKAFAEAAECSDISLESRRDDSCPRCLSGHPEAVCSFRKDPWHCENCGKRHFNTGVGRYVCSSCLHSRPEMDMVSESWVCASCSQCSPEFESFCIGCDAEKMPSAVRVPFLPTKCGRCNKVHLEALCPHCTASPPNKITDGFGTVCVVNDKYAFIQPLGTSDPAERVFVQGEIINELLEGQRVRFDAQEGVKKGQLKAISVRESSIY